MIFLNIEIKNKTENKLLSRIEVTAEISFSGKSTPNMNEVKDAATKALEIDKELLIIKKIHTDYGHSKAIVTIFQYYSKEDLSKIEPKPKVKKDKKAEEK